MFAPRVLHFSAFHFLIIIMSHICTASCTAYGWKDTFPIEAKIGDTVILTVGYLKGTPPGRILFEVEYDTNGKGESSLLVIIVQYPLLRISEVSVDRTTVILGPEDERVQVTVLDDGQSVLEDKNITITLVRRAGGSAHDILISEAILTISANSMLVIIIVQFTSYIL